MSIADVVINRMMKQAQKKLDAMEAQEKDGTISPEDQEKLDQARVLADKIMNDLYDR
jgi:hypothetical protein